MLQSSDGQAVGAASLSSSLAATRCRAADFFSESPRRARAGRGFCSNPLDEGFEDREGGSSGLRGCFVGGGGG